MWRKILKMRKEVSSFMTYRVGDGSSVSLGMTVGPNMELFFPYSLGARTQSPLLEQEAWSPRFTKQEHGNGLDAHTLEEIQFFFMPLETSNMMQPIHCAGIRNQNFPSHLHGDLLDL